MKRKIQVACSKKHAADFLWECSRLHEKELLYWEERDVQVVISWQICYFIWKIILHVACQSWQVHLT